ncbi:hypothetical protein BpHYR1_004521 [Brachionus plicatilis]|uniref:Uncharacterized protein n=1 Tax=Brachionus plicatilis TaxID=10195 RepID=A0A3M7SJ46_BRAPC|nr:hypothetical protein BpHYR1_004521 [Brachionus plicatilis]
MLLKRFRIGVYDYVSIAKEFMELDDIESISEPLTHKKIVNMVSQSNEMKIEEDIQAELETEKITFKDAFETAYTLPLVVFDVLIEDSIGLITKPVLSASTTGAVQSRGLGYYIPSPVFCGTPGDPSSGKQPIMIHYRRRIPMLYYGY